MPTGSWSRWAAVGSCASPGTSRIRRRTRFTLSNVFDDLGKAARDAAGWHSCIDALERDLDGAPPPAGSPRAAWERLNRAYVERFGPEAATIGPPAGHPYNA